MVKIFCRVNLAGPVRKIIQGRLHGGGDRVSCTSELGGGKEKEKLTMFHTGYTVCAETRCPVQE